MEAVMETGDVNEFEKSIMEMAMGAFQERADYEMSKIIQNILDANTSPTAKRRMTITLDFKPDEDRSYVEVSCTVKSTLAATKPVATMLYVANAETVTELTPQIAGQTDLYGGMQTAPSQLKLIRNN